MAKSGDTPFDPTQAAFTVSEAARVSGNSELDIRNWMRREVVPVGQKNRLGRIMFTALDIVRLKVIGDLSRLLKTEPSASGPLAEYVADHCARWMQKSNHELHLDENGHRLETRLLLHFGEDGRTPSITPIAWGESVFAIKVSGRGEGMMWTRHPFLVLPVEQFFGDVLEELFQILEGEND